MEKKLNLGIIGMSDGNGHPYSWSAIFNGFDKKAMSSCPFPVIPEYLNLQSFPEDGLGDIAQVTHIWTQDLSISRDIAKSSCIPNVVTKLENMIGEVDAVLLARDDAENHLEMARPFLKAGIPIFIDKPLALTTAIAKEILSLQQYENQIFTCSSLRYSDDLMLSSKDLNKIGSIQLVRGSIPKSWEKYAIHIIEPIIKNVTDRGALLSVNGTTILNTHHVVVAWENLIANLMVTGTVAAPLDLSYHGSKGFVVKQFKDTFYSFRESLKQFILLQQKKIENISRSDTMEIINIIESYKYE